MTPPPAHRPSHEQSPAAADTRRYDSFVVRLWRDGAGQRLLRAEVRHVQTNLAETAVDIEQAWVLRVIRQYLSDEALDDTPATESSAVPKER